MKNLDLDLKQIEPKSMQIRISNAKNSLRLVDYFKNFVDNYNDKKFYEIYKAYQEELKNCDSIDFDDLLLLPLKLFREYPDRLEKSIVIPDCLSDLVYNNVSFRDIP